MLRQASRRLQILALIGAAWWALGHLAVYLSSPEDPRWSQFGTTDVIAVINCLSGLVVYGYLRSGDRNPAFVLNLAMVFMVVERLVFSCLAKKPEDRPQNAADLDRELAEIRTEPWSQEEAQRWWRQHQPA